MDSPLDWAIVGLIGATVGIGELVSRYRDEPFATIRTPPSIFYLAVNGAASLAALALIRVFDWKFGATSEDTIRWIQVSVAGFGAMALFRSSLFNVRVGNQDVALGPSTFLSIILDAADREVDRVRARSRARSVDRTMRGVAFTSAHTALPTYCLALMQNLSRENQDALSSELAVLRDDDTIDERTKALILGLSILNVVGEGVLEVAVDTLGQNIVESPAQPGAQPPSGPAQPGAQPPSGPAQPGAQPPSGPAQPGGQPPSGPAQPGAQPPSGP